MKALSENNLKEIVAKLGSEEIDDRLVISIQKLYEQLQATKGKKVYGYLPKDVKQTVDDIFLLLAQDKNVQELYDKWCEFESAKYRTYTQKEKKFPSLTENKEFQSVRSMIIRTVMKMNSAKAVSAEPEFIEIPDDVHTEEIVRPKETVIITDPVVKERAPKRKQAQKYINSNDERQDISKGIRILTDLAEDGDDQSAYKLGKIYLNGDIVYKDYNKAEKYLKQASDDNGYAMYALTQLYLSDERKNLSEAVRLLEKACSYDGVRPFAAYTYAKILLDDNEFHDNKKAIQLLKENADSNSWCSYLLGKLYLLGNNEAEIDKTEAIKWLSMSAESENQYAQELLTHSDSNNSEVLVNTVVSMLTNLGRIIEEDNRRSRKNISRVDRKLLQTIHRKKRELGIKSDSLELEYNR